MWLQCVKFWDSGEVKGLGGRPKSANPGPKEDQVFRAIALAA